MNKIGIFILFFYISSASADYYDQCAIVLAKGAFNTKEVSTDYRAQSDFKEFMCSNAYEVEKENIDKAICESTSSSNSKRWDSNFNYINLISGTGNADLQKTFRKKYCSSDTHFKYGEWSASHCSSTSSSTNNKSITHTLIKRASPEILKAWENCVLKNKSRTDLICYGKEHGDLLSINIGWDHKYASTLKKVKITHPNLNMFGDKPKKILRGNAKLVFERKENKKFSLVQVSAEEQFDGNKYTLSCEYAVPPPLCKKVVYKLGRDPKCGVSHYLSGRSEICGVEKYKSAQSINCGLGHFGVSAGDGGCSACGGQCKRSGGTLLSCNEDTHRKIGKRTKSCGGTCGVAKTCAHPNHGIESYKECNDASFGIVYNECRLPEFGVERCDDK